MIADCLFYYSFGSVDNFLAVDAVGALIVNLQLSQLILKNLKID